MSFSERVSKLAKNYADILWNRVRYWTCGDFSILSKMDYEDIYQQIVCFALERHSDPNVPLDKRNDVEYCVKYGTNKVWYILRKICQHNELSFREEVYDDEEA